MLREGVNGSSALACRGGAYFAGGELARRGGPARRRDEAGSDGGIHRRLVTVACGGRSEKEGSAFNRAEACTTDPSGNRAELNRQTQEVEHLVTLRKQTTASCSNRQKVNFCETQKLSVLPRLVRAADLFGW
jgi:hypothetical protein